MNIFELKIWDDERRLCTFYTVQWEGARENETDKFLKKYENDPSYEESLQQLLSFVLLAIGDDHGAMDCLFNRHENEVTGLPVKGLVTLGEMSYHYPRFPLRLYALKITEGIVVLFNGGVKDNATNQTGSLSLQWREACHFAKRIDEAIRNKEILIDPKKRILTDAQGKTEIIV